jgi:ribosomal protein S18 acetylase RimI-like enzyme
MALSWRVRAARPSDGAVLGVLWAENDALHARLRPEFFRAPPPGDQAARAEARITSSLRGGPHVVLTAEDEAGAVRGLIELNLYDTPRSDLMVPTRRAHVDHLVVAAGFRRRGCARALVEAGQAWAKGRGAVELVLTVWEGNEEAEQFYASLGYRCINRVLGTRL